MYLNSVKSNYVLQDVRTSVLYYISTEKELDAFYDDFERPQDLKIMPYKED